jgi:hypothetical protein
VHKCRDLLHVFAHEDDLKFISGRNVTKNITVKLCT